jgi:hypothetical protein
MYKTCPRCGHIRQAAENGPSHLCAGCGLDFREWLRQKLQAERQAELSESEIDQDNAPLPVAQAHDTWFSRLLETLLAPPPQGGREVFYARLLGYALFFVWGWYFILLDFRGNEIGNSFMHTINLVFHEAGHVIFRLFGDFMTVLGGTLGQLLMPLIVMLALLLKNRDTFGASLGLWWLGQSLMDCAPYINDARAGKLLLLGGVTGQDAPDYHDWQNILSRLDWLAYDHRLAALADGAGTLLMLLAFAWGGAVLYRQYRLDS